MNSDEEIGKKCSKILSDIEDVINDEEKVKIIMEKYKKGDTAEGI